LEKKAVMGNMEEVLQALIIGMNVATFLLNTRRVLKAIEVHKECLLLLNNRALDKEKQFVKEVRISVYYQIFKGCGLINNLTSAIECGRKLLVLLRECGMKHKEAAVSIKLSEFYNRQSKYKEATELCKKSTQHPHRK